MRYNKHLYGICKIKRDAKTKIEGNENIRFAEYDDTRRNNGANDSEQKFRG